MTTISFSVEDALKRNIEKWAKRAKKSKSDILRDMAVVYEFNMQLDYHTEKMDKTLQELGIRTEAELYDYLESDETYEDRLRHQRLSGSR